MVNAFVKSPNTEQGHESEVAAITHVIQNASNGTSKYLNGFFERIAY